MENLTVSPRTADAVEATPHQLFIVFNNAGDSESGGFRTIRLMGVQLPLSRWILASLVHLFQRYRFAQLWRDLISCCAWRLMVEPLDAHTSNIMSDMLNVNVGGALVRVVIRT